MERKKYTRCADFLHEFRSKMGISSCKLEKKLISKMKLILKVFFRFNPVCLNILGAVCLLFSPLYYGVTGTYRYLWCACEFYNVNVWTKSFLLVSLGALYNKSSLLWFPLKSSDFEWKSSIFEIRKFWRISLKITRLYRNPQERAFVVQSS